MKVDLIIPTYKPDQDFLDMIASMEFQTIPLNKVIIMNTEQKYYERILFCTTFAEDYKNLECRHLSKREFDHGRTRNQGVKRSEADYFIMMTQDAVPVNNELIEHLLDVFSKNDKVVVAYARQVPREDCSEIEKFTRAFNYPEQSVIKSKADLPKLGIKTYFCSNVCAMYRRDVFDQLGGFTNHIILNEDMLYAAKAINAGYEIAYVAEAQVVHSHNYSNKEYYRRNFDIGVSHASNPETFEKLNTKGEGMKLVKMTAEHLKKTGHSNRIIGLYITSAYKYLGYVKGKKYKKLSNQAIMKKTLNKEFWIKDDLLRERNGIDAHKGYGRSEEELKMLSKPPVRQVREDTSDPQN